MLINQYKIALLYLVQQFHTDYGFQQQGLVLQKIVKFKYSKTCLKLPLKKSPQHTF